ncbi:hypothetical protein RAS1_39780 [Phycisphaerae bacterium RAS1]|nr:hypothetical protein RAS1_39780 [Phycisphaerae bacterium RAS1]
MSDPLAYLLTFRTYGTWLHGDDRGSIDDRNNLVDNPLWERNDAWRQWEKGRLRAPPVELGDPMRRVIEKALHDECSFRGWNLIELAVRTNHVHAVLGFAELPPEQMAGKLKSHATRELRRAGFFLTRPVWADGVGSRRYLWTDSDVEAAAAYVREGQDVPK